MANTFSPFGFQPQKRSDSAAWTDAQREYLIAAANTHTFFKGDPVVALTTGYIDRVAIGSIPTQGTLGIFMGCEYMSTAGGTKKWSPQFPGGDTAADIKCWVITDPQVIFRCWVGTGSGSTAGGPAVQADLFANFNWQLGTGNAQSGISGAYLDYASSATTSTLPLTIVGLVTQPAGTNGTDTTTAGNMVDVILNQSAFAVGRTGL